MKSAAIACELWFDVLLISVIVGYVGCSNLQLLLLLCFVCAVCNYVMED